MKAFTDEDLRQLKESENALQRSLGIPALLHRLECAEELVRVYLGENGALGDMSDDELYQAWLASKGDGEGKE